MGRKAIFIFVEHTFMDYVLSSKHSAKHEIFSQKKKKPKNEKTLWQLLESLGYRLKKPGLFVSCYEQNRLLSHVG